MTVNCGPGTIREPLRVTCHASLHLHCRGPANAGPRPVPSPRSPRPTQDGGPLAQEPRPPPRPDRHAGRGLPTDRPTLPGRVSGRGACPAPPLYGAPPSEGLGRAWVLVRGVLPGASPPLGQTGPRDQRAADRYPTRFEP